MTEAYYHAIRNVPRRDKLVPESILVLDGAGKGWAVRPVVRVETFPPGKHPADSPIRSELTAVRATADNGAARWWGFERAYIGSDLRMHVGPVDSRDEVIATWEEG